MPIRLDARAADFAERFHAFLATKREAAADVEAAVRTIIADVAARGDEALLELTRQFDRVDLTSVGPRVSHAEIDKPKRPATAGHSMRSRSRATASKLSIAASFRVRS